MKQYASELLNLSVVTMNLIAADIMDLLQDKSLYCPRTLWIQVLVIASVRAISCGSSSISSTGKLIEVIESTNWDA